MGIKSGNMNSPKRSMNGSGGSGDEGFEEDTTKYLALPNYAHKKVKEIETLLRVKFVPIPLSSFAPDCFPFPSDESSLNF